jgi:P27 family predicted phage terminase small subunit
LPELPEPPEFLSPVAHEEWRRLIGELVALRLVTAVDVMCFGAYWEAVATWQYAVEALNRTPIEDRLVIRGKNGALRPNPLVRTEASASMLELGREFGLPPVSRTRVGGPAAPPAPSKFGGLLA